MRRFTVLSNWRLRSVCCFALWVAAQAAFAQQASRPNIIFVLTDDQGWNGTSVQMDPDVPESKSDFYQTPNLEALAARGMRFTSAYAASACTMTRAAIQTGKSPAALQMTDIFASVNPNGLYVPRYTGQPSAPPLMAPQVANSEELIPEWLDQSNTGYRTGHVGKWHIGNLTTHGYDYNSLGTPLPAGQDPKEIIQWSNSAAQFMDETVAMDQPFFLQLSLFGVHDPVLYRQATYDKYAALPPGARHNNVAYAAMTEDTDQGLGIILDKVAELGIQNNTYIFYGSDNGVVSGLGAAHNAPLFSAKGSVFEGGVRVPFIVAGPGIDEGSVSDVPVQLQDLFATVADLAGADPIEADVESASLVPVLHNGGQLPSGVPLSRAYAPNGELFNHNPHHFDAERVPASAIRDGDYKLVREYGTMGQPDKILLFNLAANITETRDVNSPLNLADDMPEKTAQMLAKLDKWIQDADASLPYDFRDQVRLEWNAAQSGADTTTWRSTNDVDSYFRERWLKPATAANAPTLVTSAAVPAELGGKAFRFDGNDTLTHEFFRVSDFRTPGVGDFDRSASLVMTFRADTLAQNQVLFESGDGAAGMSLTLGDADADGSKDDLRFRVLGANQQAITATVSLNDLASPTQEFVQAAAVFSDNPADRFVEIYIDGDLAMRVDGNDGATQSYQWDTHNLAWLGYQHAGMGGAVGGGPGGAVGANGGTGDLPFAGNFTGDIAAVSFYNYVIDPLQISPSGDFNGDGFVNAQDLTMWRGAIASNTDAGDADGDGDSDGNDFLVWQRQVGAATSSVASSLVPEPSSGLLLAACALSLAVGWRRR